jgi:hypothetical protein
MLPDRRWEWCWQSGLQLEFIGELLAEKQYSLLIDIRVATSHRNKHHIVIVTKQPIRQDA